ncbi:MAG: DUF3341 domain-containing protein [Deltaproteobacteria bacterium]|nr:DUF3341 domain-containing protein [Deltaproteobacteria bacterium]
MANDDEDTKTGKRPSSKPPEADKSPSEKAVKAAAEEAAAKGELAKAKAESEPEDKKVEAEVAAKAAERAKADAEDAKEAAEEAGDESTAAAAEMTAKDAEKTRAEALETAAEAEAELEEAEKKAASEAESKKVESKKAEKSDDGDDHHDDGDDEEGEPEMRPALYLAEYESPDDLAHAAASIRDAGYEKWDCHTPYPVHGLDKAMGLPETKIGFISFVCGMVGLASAVLMIQFMNNWDYPIIIGGKPPGSFPSMVPIMFELTVLLTGFGTLFGLFHLCRLPRHHHPIFESDRFESSTDDRFFISIEVEDPKFDLKKTRALLENTHPSHLELVEEEIA